MTSSGVDELALAEVLVGFGFDDFFALAPLTDAFGLLVLALLDFGFKLLATFAGGINGNLRMLTVAGVGVRVHCHTPSIFAQALPSSASS